MGPGLSKQVIYEVRVSPASLRADLDGGICCIAGKHISEYDVAQRIRQQTKSVASQSCVTSLLGPEQFSGQSNPRAPLGRPQEELKENWGNERVRSGREARRLPEQVENA